jgi:hypothetical protein
MFCSIWITGGIGSPNVSQTERADCEPLKQKQPVQARLHPSAGAENCIAISD